ncbi:coiled-coil and C2 domain-containing protein 1A [Spea bombifrons]|uniref:coiled-coil and C2 domain-containing protein 1A n=1 Tax=Spea bombifrons TaxID=233779 RepID=UPI0023496FDF|nr:coiled-coil and C2 domain-containing protein 1A [Spea bombifrons]
MSGRREARGGGKGTAPKGAPFLLDGFLGNGDSGDEGSLEAELLALTGGRPAGGKEKPKGKTPLPMEHIEKMAALCMQDLDEEDDEDMEDDEDLLAELEDVLGDEKEEQSIISNTSQTVSKSPQPATSSDGSMEDTLVERLSMYKEALTNAKQSGEGSKVRRYERGVKTLEDLLRSVKKGKSVSPEDIPPPVALGKVQSPPVPSPTPLVSPDPPAEQPPAAPASRLPPPVPARTNLPPPVPVKHQSPPQPLIPVTSSSVAAPSPGSDEDRRRVLERQREYKLAALRSKQQGDSDMASKYYRVAKSLDSVLSSLDSGQKMDPQSLPPPPDQLPLGKPDPPKSPVSPTPPAPAPVPPTGPPAPPRDTLDALQQRMERYRSAAEQAKSKGDDRKARMHERIVKQYQDALRNHKAGKPVNLAELPVPPGFPPIQGSEPQNQEQSIVGVLETAMKLANQGDGGGSDDDSEDEKGSANKIKAAPHSLPASQPQSAAQKVSPSKSPKPSGKAQQQLEFLEGRKKQLMAAALRSKQHRDLEGAKMFLRQAKGLESMIEAARGGLPVDISKVPSAPVREEDFTLQRKGGASSQNSEMYLKLMEKLKQQHEMCMSYSQQFTHLGNITETAKYEKLADECMKYIDLLKQAHSRGLPVPRYHHEERTVSIVKIFPELSNSDLVLVVTRAVNLPVPAGTSPQDMDTFVRFEFGYPSLEEAQKDKTSVIKSTNSPVYKEKFTLQINRNHRGLKRAIQAKGMKFEVVLKGGLFKQDRTLGTSHLKLEALESACEIREILEVMDGRKPTGGKLEVCVRVREPLTSQQLTSSTEKWLVIEPFTLPPVSAPKPKQPTPVKSPVSSVPTLYCLSVLSYEKEKLEKKVHMYRQQRHMVPDDLIAQLNDVTQRSQQQIMQLRQGGPSIRAEYVRQLNRYLQFYGDSARRLGQEGNREGAKEALYKRNLVNNELQRMNQ